MNPERANPAHPNFSRLMFWAALVVSVILRWPYMFVERMWPDEALYAWNAQRIFHHPELAFSKEITDFHPPLFSVLLSLWHFFLPPEFACQAMVLAANILGIVGIYYLGKKIRGEFAGCLAAMLLGFNLLYASIYNFVIIDGVLAVFMIAFFYILSSMSEKKITPKDFYLGLTAAALILLKWSAGLVLPLIVLYYWTLFPQWTARERLTKISVPLLIGSVTVGFLLWQNHLILGSWVPQVFTSSNDAYRAPFSYYGKLLVTYLINRPLVPFFIFGLWLSFKSADRNVRVHGFWILLALAAISGMANKDMRFLLPLIPSVVLIIAIAVETVCAEAEKSFPVHWLKPLALVLIFGFLLIFSYPKIHKDMVLNAHSFVGYKEAGQYIKEEVAQAPDTLIMAGSTRIMRYYTGINFKEFGGSISSIPPTEEEFRDIVSRTSAPIILEVDLWEGMQPKWLYPLRAQNVELLKTYGFELKTMVRKNISGTPEGADKAVVWCFRRPAKGHQ